MIVTPEMLEAATASIVLSKIEEADDGGYCPSPEERRAAEFLHRERLIFRVAEHQSSDEGYGVRWRYYALETGPILSSAGSVDWA
jgi:hypothetical protein